MRLKSNVLLAENRVGRDAALGETTAEIVRLSEVAAAGRGNHNRGVMRQWHESRLPRGGVGGGAPSVQTTHTLLYVKSKNSCYATMCELGRKRF